ncbi:hypothetical protein NAEGRDRAFT_77817 [Naegleria gruberi]|uniref:Zer-1-like leucine-rich repeats region domain-containing protein n=1 Tax=Naegleria gruberi TaxID=5762 RepID=D2UYP3_NAEGR|nr:uncharacterized protein NAEGRDRAFT_77817 [Naegleria gruberi]EFC50512.1 hypothetical protein NAEGRDRAFT_77817 [Naegleria gruberi]|eukprot:XP_002683256.1 hypothetical protein NAEGRDRAFT_77817 [Naegleria gruberi strain NEG-M]
MLLMNSLYLNRVTSLEIGENVMIESDLLKTMVNWQVCKKMNNLKRFHIYKNDIGEEGVKEILEMSQLTDVSIISNGITRDEMKLMGKLKHLTRIDLSWNPIGDEGLKSLSEMKELLTSLHVSHCKIGDLGCEIIGQMYQLTELDISSNSGWNSKVSSIGVKSISQLKKLTKLNISRNNINGEGIKSISEMKQLISLNVFNCSISKEFTKFLVSEKLTELDIGNNIYLDDSFLEMKQLRILKMEGLLVKIPEKIRQLKELTELDVSSCRSNDRDFVYDIKELRNLKKLFLRRNASIQDKGVILLSQHLEHLTELDIRDCGISYEVEKSLKHKKNLTKLVL